jgi:hypothetical protein
MNDLYEFRMESHRRGGAEVWVYRLPLWFVCVGDMVSTDPFDRSGIVESVHRGDDEVRVRVRRSWLRRVTIEGPADDYSRELYVHPVSVGRGYTLRDRSNPCSPVR